MQKTDRLKEKMLARQQESLSKHYARLGKSFSSSRGKDMMQSPASSEGVIDADSRRTAVKLTSESKTTKRVPVWKKTTESFRAKIVSSRIPTAKVHPTGE
jgi:hypothetical protein